MKPPSNDVAMGMEMKAPSNQVQEQQQQDQDQDEDEEKAISVPLKGITFIKASFLGVNALSGTTRARSTNVYRFIVVHGVVIVYFVYTLGVGILSIPFALSEGGWLSLLVLVIVAVICCYTALLLQRCMAVDPKITTYPDIGYLAFGRKGRIVISTFLYSTLYLLAVEFLILEGDNLHKLFPTVSLHIGRYNAQGKRIFIVLAAAVILPTVYMRSFKVLAYVSLGGVLASIVLLVCVFCAGVNRVGFHEKGTLWRWSGLPTALSMYSFCFCAHATFPTICNSMENRAQFNKVLVVCFVPCTMIYVSMAIMGYLMFGQHLTSQITLDLPPENLSTKIAICTTLISPLAKYALVTSPIMTAIENTSLFRGEGNHTRFLCLLMRTMLVISTVFVALIMPFFGHVMAFIGSVFAISLSMLFPCICYMKIHQVYKHFGTDLMVITLIVVCGACVSIIGTYISVRDIIANMRTK